MTAYLDEYNPNGRARNYRVQSDPQRLKYNNIKTCIAVAMYPSATGQLVGVHLTTKTTRTPREMKTVRDELRAALGNVRNCKAYLVANYTTFHATTTLMRELKKIAASVMLCNVTGARGPDKDADIDVKIELVSGRVLCSVRSHAPYATQPGTQLHVPKLVPQGGFLPGQPHNQLDTTGLPWKRKIFVRI